MYTRGGSSPLYRIILEWPEPLMIQGFLFFAVYAKKPFTRKSGMKGFCFLWTESLHALIQQFRDILFNLLRRGLRGEALEDTAFLIDQELGEVPFHAF